MFSRSRRIFALFAGLTFLTALVSTAEPIGTHFSYQGRLDQSQAPATGIFDFRFKLFDGPDPDTAHLLGTTTRCLVDVVEGLFTADLDFGDVFSAGEALWLQINVFASGNCDTFTELSPLQPLTATPFAHFALNSVPGPPGPQGDPGPPGPEGDPGPSSGASKITMAEALGSITVNTKNTWFLGPSHSITVPGPGYIHVQAQGTGIQGAPSGDFAANVQVGIALDGNGPANAFTDFRLGGDQNVAATFYTQYLHRVDVASPTTFTFFTIARSTVGGSPVRVKTDGLSLHFVSD